jgi:transposase InsO family protein
MDTFKVGPGQYQYTAIDDCTRVRVLGLYTRRTAKNAVDFLVNRVVEELPFPVQRIQTDRGTEFFGTAFQKELRAFSIKFRPTPPRSPHLNGKVERSQQTDWIEFYSTTDLSDLQLSNHLEEWQFFYNWHRPHSALNGQTPMARYFQLLSKTPFESEVAYSYNPKTERFQERNYWVDQQLKKLKRCP